jgi:hypothetical protein
MEPAVARGYGGQAADLRGWGEETWSAASLARPTGRGKIFIAATNFAKAS